MTQFCTPKSKYRTKSHLLKRWGYKLKNCSELLQLCNSKLIRTKQIILLSTKKKRPNITTLELDDIVLNISRNLVSLGITFDQRLSFEKNVNKIMSSCYSELRKLYRIKHYLSLEWRKIAVQTLIISRLDYCNAILLASNIKEISKLQRVQNAARRFVFNLRKYESCREFRYNLHWLPVAQRIDFKILTYVHKIVYNLNVPLYLKSLVLLQYKYNQTRSENKWKLKSPKVKNSYGSRAFSFLGPKKWNALPSHLRCLADHTLFKRANCCQKRKLIKPGD